ncbi:A-kinase anchor protein 1, mitochondrial isoform X2 [Nilaparvata lugens]|uniref:A-kinase anchor protein 1, mitochondrial isoform X1 n=1 Tax=Nilaparvata lugens TaxID=108931 RepID=UPI00193CEEC9|nr:A-kinase anchor protein 1, mitochondrial isoform X1 [Nilaparvata lugens]XP_039292885.1 A-kinase anchor protein 1, mitochondrial isoform X2 [Nilaparvata lugens]
MALDIKEQQRQQDELSVDRKMELSNESHDDGERDSANHSPAEIMLESPALSNFSDAHSEGSSDSGKGCSDVATPPAGGSSVSEEAEAAEAAEAEAEEAGSDAGAEAFGVYEFIIPQHLVGRLIGRHGAFLQEIRGTTHTNLFIKRHPDTNKLKICAVEGAQADIDAALSMIRHKFPLRRYPTLTLEKVTFVQVAPTCELAPEQFRLQLVEGVNNDVILSSLVSAGHMFLQQPTHPSFQQLAALNQVMNANYCYNDSPSLEEPVKDGVCAAPAPMGGWFRAQIVAVNDDEKTVELRFLDYGGYLSCEYTILKKMRYDFLLLPFQAVECCLANVTPTGGPGAVWSEEATLFVQNLIYGKILQAQIYDYTEEGMPLIYLYVTCGNQVVLVNQELVANGFAEPVTPPQAQETQQQQETKVIEE